jgi:hypothetical protein
MKARITDKGYLEILRGPLYKQQECPQQQERMPCGDWCSRFIEPQKTRLQAPAQQTQLPPGLRLPGDIMIGMGPEVWVMGFCGMMIQFEEIEDLR